jgi:hypothetical protein
MNLDTMLQAKVKELEDLRAKIAAAEEQKQKCFQMALEVQGAAKQLVELINLQKAEETASEEKPEA